MLANQQKLLHQLHLGMDDKKQSEESMQSTQFDEAVFTKIETNNE